MASPTTDPRVSLFRSVPAQLGEGAVWHPGRQSLFWIDIKGCRIHETGLAGTAVRTHATEGMVGAVIPTASGGLLAALQSGIHRFDPDTGRSTPFACPAEHDATRIRFNESKCDPQGRLWAGTMAVDESGAQGALYRITPEGRSTRMRDHVAISNGLAWSADSRTLYYIDSPTRAVQAFDFDPETGNLSRPRVAIDLASTPGFPDGCTIDVEGNLWIAFWDGGCVMRWDPVRARLLETLRIPVSQVTTCTFGGPRLDVLFVTSAAVNLTEAQRREQPEAGFVFAAQVGTSGRPADCFAG